MFFYRYLLILLSFLTIVAVPPSFAISEIDYAAVYAKSVFPFLRTGETFQIKVTGNVTLSGVRFIHPNSRGTVLIVNGRTETWLKYGEVFYDLYQRGYSLYSYDHRGQGLSTHLVAANPQIGHIERFEDFVDDLALVVRTVVVPETHSAEPLYLLAHSMGGGIVAGYLEREGSPFHAAVLTAPMLEINTDPYPNAIASLIAGASIQLGNAKKYVTGRGNYEPQTDTFETNTVTHSAARYAMHQGILAFEPSVILGGPSNGWVYRNIKGVKKIVKNASKIKIPLLMFQAGEDVIVEPGGQNRTCKAAINCQLILYRQAKHEILMERDPIRSLALQRTMNFFSRY